MAINSQEVAYAFGQHGSGHLKNTDVLYAPAGKAIVAITMLENVKFDAAGLKTVTDFHNTGTDGVSFFGTTTQTLANGTNAAGDTVESVVVANTVEFPKGLTIYGRWVGVKLSTSYTHGIIVYYGPA